MKLIFFTSAIVLCASLTKSQLISSPMNTIAFVGRRVEFECSTNVTLPLVWDFAKFNSTGFEFVYKLEQITSKFSSRYKVNNSTKGRFALLINSVDIDHAGTYKCQNTENYNPQDRNASAQLVVIDSDPVCGTNASNGGVVEGDYIQMWCTVNYTGNWILVMECSINGQISDRPTHNTYKPRRVTSSLIKQLVWSDNGITLTFTCKMSLNPNSTNNLHVPAQAGKTMATNIPRYQFSWNYMANVLYGPRNPAIRSTLVDDVLKTEIRLKCSADGNPAPDYEWEIIGKNISLNNGSILVINESMVSGEGQTLHVHVRCTARNSVTGQISSNEANYTFNLTPTTASSNVPSVLTSETILIIGTCIGALVICMAIAVIIYKIRRIGTNDADEKASGEPDQQPTYGIVNKVRKDKQEHSHREEDIPVYGEVKKKKKDKKTSGSTSKISSATEKKPNQNYTGADGTVYEEMSAFADRTCKFNKTPVKQAPLFDLVDIYASIDHTTAAPPPTH